MNKEENSVSLFSNKYRLAGIGMLLNRKLYPSDDCKLYYPI